MLGNSSLVTFPTSKQVAIDSQGNLLMSLGATGLNSDPETGIFKLTRLRFE
ncbi:MAG: hypothetical protein AB8B55_02130 [Mariniblastus sp.]